MSLRASHCCWLGPCLLLRSELILLFGANLSIVKLLNSCNKQKTIKKKLQKLVIKTFGCLRASVGYWQRTFDPIGATWTYLAPFFAGPNLSVFTFSKEVGMWGRNSRQTWEWAWTVAFLSFLSEENSNLSFQIQTKSIQDYFRRVQENQSQKQLAYQKSLKMYLRVRI